MTDRQKAPGKKPRVGFFVYNTGPIGKDGRGPRTLANETDALCNVHPSDGRRNHPDVGGLIEVIGWGDLHVPAGYKILRDRSDESRANIAMLHRADLTVNDVQWFTGKETWRETRAGASRGDRHPPRAILKARLSGSGGRHVKAIVAHGPPNTKFHDTGDARDEWLDMMVQIIDVTGPSLVMMDANELTLELKHRLEGNVVAFGSSADTESVLLRGYSIAAAGTPGTVNKVPMGSDHHKALLGRAVAR